jgi:hypothetical protein
MGMRRTQQRQLGARRYTCVGAEASRERQVIAELVWAHEESIALVRTLLLILERADARQSTADDTVALAAATPADPRAHGRAIEAAALSETGRPAKTYAADKWASHVMHLHGLMAMADELVCDPVPAPGGEGLIAAATASNRLRPRGDCLGRPS